MSLQRICRSSFDYNSVFLDINHTYHCDLMIFDTKKIEKKIGSTNMTRKVEFVLRMKFDNISALTQTRFNPVAYVTSRPNSVGAAYGKWYDGDAERIEIQQKYKGGISLNIYFKFLILVE